MEARIKEAAKCSFTQVYCCSKNSFNDICTGRQTNSSCKTVKRIDYLVCIQKFKQCIYRFIVQRLNNSLAIHKLSS